jgi:hypothetical protein
MQQQDFGIQKLVKKIVFNTNLNNTSSTTTTTSTNSNNTTNNVQKK